MKPTEVMKDVLSFKDVTVEHSTGRIEFRWDEDPKHAPSLIARVIVAEHAVWTAGLMSLGPDDPVDKETAAKLVMRAFDVMVELEKRKHQLVTVAT